jgi:hypothetical protein
LPGAAAAAPVGWSSELRVRPAGGDDESDDVGDDDDGMLMFELGSGGNEGVVSDVSGDCKVKVRRRAVGDTCVYTYVGRWQAVRAY